MSRVVKSEAYRMGMDGHRDQAGRARVLMRVDRLIHGNPGHHRNLSEGVAELKIGVAAKQRRPMTLPKLLI